MPTTESKKRSGISSDRAYSIQSKMKSKLLDIISANISYKSTHDEIMERINVEVFNHEDMKKAPTYVHSYLQGVLDTKREEIYHYHLVWMLSCDGKLMTSQEVDELTKKEMADLYAAHVKWCNDSFLEYYKNGGSCRHPDTFEGFSKLFSQPWKGSIPGLPIRPEDYKSPWSRTNGDLSRHVWKDAQGNPLRDKPYDRKFL